MQIKNTEQRYGLVAMLFHWGIAILIFGMLGVGLYMADLPLGTEKLRLYGLHKEFGVLILMLAIARIIWRFANITPPLPASTPLWQRLAAHGVHYAMYGFLIFMPLTGWMISSASGLPVSFFGLFILPNPIAPNEQYRIFLTEVHQWLAYGLIAAICAHVGAALQHHFILKDNIFRRMLP